MQYEGARGFGCTIFKHQATSNKLNKHDEGASLRMRIYTLMNELVYFRLRIIMQSLPDLIGISRAQTKHARKTVSNHKNLVQLKILHWNMSAKMLTYELFSKTRNVCLHSCIWLTLLFNSRGILCVFPRNETHDDFAQLTAELCCRNILIWLHKKLVEMTSHLNSNIH